MHKFGYVSGRMSNLILQRASTVCKLFRLEPSYKLPFYSCTMHNLIAHQLTMCACFWSGFLGSMVAAILLTFERTVFSQPAAFGFGKDRVFALALFMTHFESPAVGLGRCINLPIQENGAHFISYDLNGLGCLCVVLFWGSIGLSAGITAKLATQAVTTIRSFCC